jgi:hypothetical protein
LVVMDVVWPYLSNGGLPQLLWALLALAEPTPAGAQHQSVMMPKEALRSMEAT